jgi:hypothetical protein
MRRRPDGAAPIDRPASSHRRPAIVAVWAVAGVLVALEAAHQAFGLGGAGANRLFDDWLHNGLMWLAAAMCLGGALRVHRSRSRTPWLLLALGLASWAAGETIWSVRYGTATAFPAVTVSDALWLAWYPLAGAALALLVHDRVPRFELHRWIDGVAVLLIVATPWVALFLQPVAEESTASTLDATVEFVYPLLDAVLAGSVLGVFALMGWRPGRMWIVLGLGLATMGVSDAIYSVEVLADSYVPGIENAALVVGALLIAYASWEPHPGRLEPSEVTGWPAIALPLAAQALAVAVQVYAYFAPVPESERLLTVVVLLIAMVQIIVTRPRRRPALAARLERAPGAAAERPHAPPPDDRGE